MPLSIVGGVAPLPYGFFLTGGFFSPPLGLISAKKSLALNGHRRVDCCPVVLKVTSTRRLLASTNTCRLFSICCQSAGLKSGFCAISSFIWSAVSWSSLPNDRVSKWSAGTPCSTRKFLVRSTRRCEGFVVFLRAAGVCMATEDQVGIRLVSQITLEVRGQGFQGLCLAVD